MRTGFWVKAAVVAWLLTPGAAPAAEVRVVASNGVKAALEDLAARFQRSTQHQLKFTFGTAVPLKRRIEGGEAFDVAILTPALIENLVKQKKVVADTTSKFARIGIGVAVRRGAPKPDIVTVEAFKNALIKAKSIVYSTEGQSGIAVARLIERFGLAEQLKAKTVLETRSGGSMIALVEGKAELGFSLVSEILPVQGVELVGPLPAEIQSYVMFTAGISTATSPPNPAQSYVNYLGIPSIEPVLKAKGMERWN